MSKITENDKYVLNAIFNPTYPLDFDKESPSDLTDSENESKIFFWRLYPGSVIHFFLLEQALEVKKLEEEGIFNISVQIWFGCFF